MPSPLSSFQNWFAISPYAMKAWAWSFCIHAITIALFVVWGSLKTDRFATSGARDAVHLQASLADPAPMQPIEVPQEPEQPIDEAETEMEEEQEEVIEENESQPAPTTSVPRRTAIDFEPRVTQVERRTTEPVSRPHQVERPRREYGSLESAPESSATPAHKRAIPRRSEPMNQEAPRPETRRGRPPQMVTTSSVAAVPESQPQTAGIDDKQPPDFSGNRPPVYPTEAFRRGVEGTVLLRLFVSKSGQVERVEIVNSSGHPILDEAAVTAVRAWSGQPATRGGLAMESIEVLPVNFNLDRESARR